MSSSVAGFMVETGAFACFLFLVSSAYAMAAWSRAQRWRARLALAVAVLTFSWGLANTTAVRGAADFSPASALSVFALGPFGAWPLVHAFVAR